MANEQHQERLHRFISELDAITQGMWHTNGGVMEKKIEKMKENLDEQAKKIQKERGE